jgi:SRSO17 transposase
MVRARTRHLQEILFGLRRDWHYWTITTNPEKLPENSTCHLMSHLPQPLDKQVGNLYGLRTWIEYGFKQCKNHLGSCRFSPDSL